MQPLGMLQPEIIMFMMIMKFINMISSHAIV